MTRRDVMITIRTVRRGVPVPLFRSDEAETEEDCDEEYDDEFEEWGDEESGEAEEAEILTEGRLITTSQRVELVYEESELTGMEGSVTKLGFDRAVPELISLLRGGTVSTALVFESRKRHVCVYDTPFSGFEVCVQTIEVRNELLTKGELYLDYLIEIHGARTERCKMNLTVR